MTSATHTECTLIRAEADMILEWVLSESRHCSVEIAEWFPTEMDRQRLLDLLDIGRPKLCVLSRQEKVDAWLRSWPLN